MKTLLLAQHEVEERERRGRNGDSAGGVDGRVKRELDALNQVKGDCVFEAIELEADVGEVEERVWSGVHGGGYRREVAGEVGYRDDRKLSKLIVKQFSWRRSRDLCGISCK